MNEFDSELLYELIEDVSLNEAALIIALEGWIDAGLGASSAMNALLESGPTTLVACFDADEFLDQRARRPIVRIVDGVNQGLSWPEIELRAGKDLDEARIPAIVEKNESLWGSVRFLRLRPILDR